MVDADTANRTGRLAAAAGDWGGLYVGHTSSASLDHVVLAYGGGTTRIEGGFADSGLWKCTRPIYA